MIRIPSILLILYTFISPLYGQNVSITPTIDPQFFSADETITITYDVTGTSLSNLNEAWIWFWLPNVSNGDVASNVNPASSNSSATNPAKFTKTTENGRTLFRISLTPTLFTGKSKEEISTIGMLLKGNDWADGQTIDFTADVTEGFTMHVSSPSSPFAFYSSGQSIEVQASTSEIANFQLSIDNEIIETLENNNTFSTTHTAIDDGEVHQLTIRAFTDNDEAEFTHTYIIEPETESAPLPDNVRDGINYHEDSTSATLVLRAPQKNNVFVIGSFNNWSLNSDFLMKKDGDHFWLTISGLEKGKEYIFQYLVDGNIRIADPYAEKVSSPYDDPQIINENRYPELLPYPDQFTDHEASYLQTARPQFSWTATDYIRPAKEDLVIYELLVRDFTEERTYQAVIDKLDYLESLGINALELMPVMEFEGNLSWGYNPSFKLAVDKFYGTENDLKRLIDECHKRGIAVILDIVLNHHFGRSPLVRLYNDAPYGSPTASNPWFNRTARHDFNVGYDFNHESELTKYYVDRVNEYWIKEYNIDGYRFDLSKGFTQRNTIGNIGAWNQYDASRVALLKRMADKIWETDPDNYVILEHFADNSEETELANYGMMLWGNMHGAYINAGRGNGTNISWAHHRARGWEDQHLVGYMESHDEERQLWELKKTNKSDEELYQRMKQNAAFFFMIPGPKMLWQFGEFGYDLELNNDRLGIKPTQWDYLNDPERKKLFDVYQSLIKLKIKTDYLKQEYFTWNGSAAVKWMQFEHPDVQIIVMGNFSNQLQRTPVRFTSNGTWYNYFTKTPFEVNDFANDSISLSAGEFRIFTSEIIDNYLEGEVENIVMNTENNRETGIVLLYPNPARDQIKVRLEKQQSDIQSILIRDINGKRINYIDNIGQRSYNLDISHYPSGIYIFSIKHHGGVAHQRIIKQ